MDNKPPLTYSAAVSKSLQSPLAHVTKTPAKSGLNPEAPPFVPGQRYIPQSSHQHLSTSATHLPRNVTTTPAKFGQHTVQPAKPKTRQAARRRGGQSSASLKSRQVARPDSNKHIAEIITLLNNRPGEAEKKCRWLQGNEPQFEPLTVAQLLAKAILRQDKHRASEAERVLIRQHTFWNNQQVSLAENYYANMTIVCIWQAQKKYDRAIEALIRMANVHRQSSHMPTLEQSGALTTPCGDKKIDLAMVRLQEEKGDFDHAEILLQAMRKHQCRKKPTLNLTEPCGDYKFDLAMVRLQQKKGDLDRAETLLQAMRKERSRKKPTLNLTEPCGENELDLVMVRLQEEKGNFDRAETLLQGMRKGLYRKTLPELTEPCGEYKLDLAMVRLQEEKGNFVRAETLLQVMRKKYRRDRTLELTDPCGKHELDLVMVRLQESKGDFDRAETLLQAMRKKYCKEPNLKLTESCGNHELDLVMVRLQQEKGDFDPAETLLQAMRKAYCSQQSLKLAEPCGNHELDLAMVWLLQDSGKLLGFDEYFAKYPTGSFLHVRLLEYVRCSQIDEFNRLISKLPPSPERELTNSIRYFQNYVKSILNRSDSSPRGRLDEGKKALRIADNALQKYPYHSSLLSQKAHCLRMLGRPAQEWEPLFQQARAINPKRAAREKNDYWRKDEARALKLLGVSCQL